MIPLAHPRSRPPFSALLPLSTLALALLLGCGGSSNSGGGGGNGNPVSQQVATPTFSPAAGTFTAAQSVSLADITPGATLYYTTDGSTPTSASTKYSASIAVTATTTLSAIAEASGDTNSLVATAVYTINAPSTATPTFSLPAGNYTSAQSLTLADTTPSAVLYYTLDGTTPTTGSTVYATPIAITAKTTVEAFAVAPGDAASAVATAAYTIGVAPPTVSVVLSTHDQTSLLAPQTAVTFGSSPALANQLQIDETQQYQTVDGFGAAFTDSAAYVLEKEAQPAQLTTTLSDLFTRNGNGIGLSFMRNPMGASDLARSVYSFDDEPSGQTDPTLTNFSIAHDQSYILPLIVSARALNPHMKIMANPWSPPAWMKDSGTMNGGSLLAIDYPAYAQYFVKYLQDYAAAGVPIDFISLANEPLNNTNAYPSISLPAASELTLLRDDVLPAMTAANLTTQIFVYDHNWDTPSYPTTVLSDPTVLASPLVAGTAWHGYAGPVGAQQGVANQFPTKGNWQTEHSGGTFIADQFTDDFEEITLVLRNAGKAYVKWSLALDQTLGPNLSQVPNAGYGGCNTCTPIVTVNSSTGAITRDIEFYTLGQFSKYILPGATRIWSSDTPTIVSSAFVNPDNTRVLVAFNNASSPQTFQVQWGTQNFTYTLPAFAAATFTWSGTATSAPTLPATQQIQGASYSSQSGLETEITGDTTGSYDLGYVNPGAYTVYKNVAFGTGVSSVNVRAASGGGGGTVSFYLDSLTSAPIATVTIPPTGGWQTWQTFTAPVTAASGAHTLYAVLNGTATNGLFNLNWFQFQP